MNIVINKVRIRGSIGEVFDLVTTARYWPDWHPSTLCVDGVIDRPYQLGDSIRQIARIADVRRDGVWTVTEHVRSEKIALQMHDGCLEIRYTFMPLRNSTRIVRRLAYTANFVDKNHNLTAFEQMMHAESELGLQQLKILIENILHDEGRR